MHLNTMAHRNSYTLEVEKHDRGVFVDTHRHHGKEKDIDIDDIEIDISNNNYNNYMFSHDSFTWSKSLGSSGRAHSMSFHPSTIMLARSEAWTVSSVASR
jgi:hypothetical protein